MVDGFIVDEDSPKPDCIACTEAKKCIEPLLKSSIRNNEANELTHIDLWRKYLIRAIDITCYLWMMPRNLQPLNASSRNLTQHWL